MDTPSQNLITDVQISATLEQTTENRELKDKFEAILQEQSERRKLLA